MEKEKIVGIRVRYREGNSKATIEEDVSLEQLKTSFIGNPSIRVLKTFIPEKNKLLYSDPNQPSEVANPAAQMISL